MQRENNDDYENHFYLHGGSWDSGFAHICNCLHIIPDKATFMLIMPQSSCDLQNYIYPLTIHRLHPLKRGKTAQNAINQLDTYVLKYKQYVYLSL